MAVTADQLLEEIRKKKQSDQTQRDVPVISIHQGKPADSQQPTADQLLDGIRSGKPFSPQLDTDVILGKKKPHGVRSVTEGSQMVNQGLFDVFMLPIDLIDGQRAILGGDTADRLGAPKSMYGQANQYLADKGVLPQPDDKPEGILADSLQFFGGSLPFGFGILKYGQNVARSVPKNMRNMFSESAVQASSSPMAMAGSIATDFSSSVGAAVGTKAAEEMGLGPGGTVTLQLLGGFTHPMSIMSRIGTSSAVTRARDLIPVGKGRGERRAASEVQRAVSDPEAAASRIDPNANIPAARQVGEEGALQLEQRVLNTDPQMRQQYTDDLNQAVEEAINDGRRLGNPDVAGATLQGQQNRATGFSREQSARHIRVMELRAAQAAQEAEVAVSRLGPDASPDDISRVAREKIEKAYRDGRDIETEAWNKVDDTGTVELNATRKAIAEEKARMSERFSDQSLIPPKVRRLLAVDAKSKAEPKKGVKPEAPITVRDVQAVRSEITQAYDTARREGRKNDARILKNLKEALFDDIQKSGANGVDEAIAVSRKFNETFTQGAVGDLLSVRAGGVPRITPRETLPTITGRKAAAESLRQMISADPSVENNVREFITSSYYTSVLLEAGGNPSRIQSLHKQFVRRMKKQGVFDVLDGVEDQLVSTRNSVLKDANVRGKLDAARKQGGLRARENRKKAAANQYLGGNGEITLNALFESKTPAKDAAMLRRAMEGDAGARDGLKAAFVDSMYQRFTDNTGTLNAAKLGSFIDNNKDLMRSIGMTPDDIKRMEKISETVKAVRMKPSAGAGGPMIDDDVGFAINAFGRWVAVRAAAVVPTKGAGASLQMANIFSGRMAKLLEGMGVKEAERILKAAHTDNELYRALLIKPTDTPARQAAAAKRIEAWLPSVMAQNNYREYEDQ